ncbi:MAG TPA: xanthine dehydrogenase family protein subunit M [Chloroflexota bacterium]|nr:xanthine dehydrogenase family protein subunit M [Chloroflexota bacterium]
MKPAPFQYAEPTTVEEALQILHERGDEAKVLAGGQSLIPLLNMRLAMPELLVDINRVEGLDAWKDSEELSLGALVRQREIEENQDLATRYPLLAEAIRYVGHPQIRNRGTVLGSLAHADPAAELPLVFTALEGRFELQSLGSSRTVSAEDFFLHIMTTALEPDELLVRARIPRREASTGSCFSEVARRHGDFAVVAVAVTVRVEEGVCRAAAIALGGVGPTPLRAAEAEEWLRDQDADARAFDQAGKTAARECAPASDIHGSAEYRREAASALVSRALRVAAGRALE